LRKQPLESHSSDSDQEINEADLKSNHSDQEFKSCKTVGVVDMEMEVSPKISKFHRDRRPSFSGHDQRRYGRRLTL